MKHRFCPFKLALVLVLFVLVLASAISAQSSSAYLFLTINNNARTAGLGNANIGPVDESSPLYNSAAMGLYYFDHTFAFSKSNKTGWLPRLTDDLYLTSRSTSIGASLKQLMPRSRLPFDLSFGLAVSKLKVDFGEFTVTDAGGNVLRIYDAYEKAEVTSFGLGLKRVVRLGFGYSHKKLSSSIFPEAKGTAHDWSFMAQLPVHELLEGRLRFFDKDEEFNLRLTPSYAYVKANIGDSVVYGSLGGQLSPLPETEKKSWSILASLDLKQASLLSYRYQDETGEMDQNKTSRKGTELGIGGFYYIRNGSYKDPLGAIDIETDGWGLSLRGLLDLAHQFRIIDRVEGPLGFILDRIDIRVDQAEYSGDGTQSLHGTKFTNWSISL